jgi:predicted acylesterase/phospholipase RssA
MDCLIALRMSANFPFLFDPFVYDDYSYIDGGIANNFPIDQATPEECVIGLHLRQNNIQREHPANENLIGRVSNILFIPIQKMEDIIIEKARNENVDVVSIGIPINMLFHFTLSTTDKFDMFSIGYNSTREYFEKKSSSSHHNNDDDFIMNIV